MGEEASKLLKRGSVTWAFAINHCAYVGVCGRISEKRVGKYVRMLLDIRDDPEIWNFRFADTLAYEPYVRARRLYNEMSAGNEVDRKMEGVRHLVEQAHERARLIEPSFGDAEVLAHVDEINTLWSEVCGAPAPEQS